MGIHPSDVEAKTFKIVRKGYDPEAVHEYLGEVGRQMSHLSELAKIAGVRAEQLGREIHDVRQSADNVADAYQEALDTRRQLLADAEEEAASIRAAAGSDTSYTPRPLAPLSEEQASIEAIKMLAEARADVERTEAAAETILKRALSASERIEAEMEAILAESHSEGAEVLTAAHREADEIRHQASLAAEADRSELEAEQRDLMHRVRALQSTVTRLEAEEERLTLAAASAAAAAPDPGFAPDPAVEPDPVPAPTPKAAKKQTGKSRKASSKKQAVEPAPAFAAEAVVQANGDAPLVDTEPVSVGSTTKKAKYANDPPPSPTVVEEEVVVSLVDDDTTVDVTDSPDGDETDLQPAGARRKPSRYKARSANLPHLGDGAGSVLGDMQSFRKKEA